MLLHENQLSGYLHIRGFGKSSKKKNFFILDDSRNQLLMFKNIKDVEEDKISESLQLFGADVSFGNVDDHEFVINIRGTEYWFTAENHKTMMKWTSSLEKQVKVKSNQNISTLRNNQLESVPENDALEIRRVYSTDQKRPAKRKSFLMRWFSRKGRSGSKKEAVPDDSTNKENRVIKAAPLRSVVGSMQDLSTKPSVCKNCDLLQGHNTYLTTQVQQLNDDIEGIKEQLRMYMKKFAVMERSQSIMKRSYLTYIQNTLVQDENIYKNLLDIPGSKDVIELLNQEREQEKTLPNIDSNGILEVHEDHLGFLHGNRESQIQLLLYICDVLKFRFTSMLQEGDDIYQQWQTYAASIITEPVFTIDKNLEELVTNGIPHSLRGFVWKMLIMKRVQEITKEKGERYYQSLVDKLPDLSGEEDENDGTIEKQVKIDLLRTMPTHKDFQNLVTGKVPSLHRVLRAFLLHNPEIGYSQGMNFMVGFALLYLDEETSFWCLVAIVEIFFGKNHYNRYLSGTQANQKVIEEICYQEFPDLMEHLDELNCELSPITFNWFMTVYIDSLPTQVVLHIWDIFLVYGHPILYKVALSLVKFHRAAILSGRDSLSTMRKLKRLGRSYHDANALLKDVFNGSFQETPDYFLNLYEKHLKEIEVESNKRQLEDEEYEKEKLKLKFTPKQMTVSISDNLDQLDDDLIIQCAQCATNRNYVWLLCTSDLMGQIYVLNVASRNLEPIDWQIQCKCLAIASVRNSDIMLVSTIKSTLHGIDVEGRNELWFIQLAHAALDISCDADGNVALALMDGTVAFLNIKSKEFHQNFPTYVDISRSPVFCGCISDETYWCGAANKIVLVDIKTLETTTSLRVCPNERHTVSQLVQSQYGIWSSVKGSSVLHLWDTKKHVCLLTVDVLEECGLTSEKKKGDSLAVSITTIMCMKQKVWVGFGNGRFVICDILMNANTEDDLNDIINLYKSMENLPVDSKENGMKKSPSKLSVVYCCHQIMGEEKAKTGRDSPVVQYLDDRSDFVMVDKRASMHGQDIKLKMHQIQRVSESPVNYFIPCRQDNKLVLSCMGAINDDSSVILWSSEKRDDREMWFAQTVSCNE